MAEAGEEPPIAPEAAAQFVSSGLAALVELHLSLQLAEGLNS
jgi:hypothetical protein